LYLSDDRQRDLSGCLRSHLESDRDVDASRLFGTSLPGGTIEGLLGALAQAFRASVEKFDVNPERKPARAVTEPAAAGNRARRRGSAADAHAAC
jgi:hypothetical protein